MRKYLVVLIYVTSLVFVSCNSVHELPGDDPIDPTLISFNIKAHVNVSDLDLEGYDLANISSEEREIRMVIEFVSQDGGKIISSVEYIKESEIIDGYINLEKRYSFIDKGIYNMAVWCDYLSDNRYFYDVENLNEINYLLPFDTSSHDEDCFGGVEVVDLTSYNGVYNATKDVVIELSRPVSKYYIITEDIAQFIEKETKLRSVDEVLASGSELSNYSITIYHTGYMANRFNIYNWSATKAEEGISYPTTIEKLNDSEGLLAFKHIFPNSSTTKSYIAIELRDSDGELINYIDDIEVPLIQGEATVVRGNFLTYSSDQGVTVNPDFEGETDIWIGD